jgi:hypothetical protein
MTPLRLIVEEYLSNIGQLKPIVLGDGEERPLTKQDNQNLIGLLEQRAKSNSYIVIITIVMLIVLFVLALFFLFYYRNDTKTVGFIFGVTLLSNLGIIGRLRKLWIEKNMVDISLIVTERMPPNQAAKFINLLYWNLIKSPRKGAGQQEEAK